MAFQKGNRMIAKKALETSIKKETIEDKKESILKQDSGAIKLSKKKKDYKKRVTYTLDQDTIDKLKKLSAESEYSASAYLNELIKKQYESIYRESKK